MTPEIKESFDNRTPVIVLGLTANGLSVVRSLGRRGIVVYGASDNPKEYPGCYSRYLRAFIELPSHSDGFKSSCDALISFAKDFIIKPLLFPTSDRYVLLVSRNREKLASYFQFILPQKESVECFLDKRSTTEFAVNNGIRYPRTWFFDKSFDVQKAGRQLVYPCFLKPTCSHEFEAIYKERKGFVLNNASEFEEIYRDKIQPHSIDFMVQQIIKGSDSSGYDFCAYADTNHKIRAYAIARKMRQYPLNFGVSSLTIIENNDNILEAAQHVLEKVRFSGLLGIEFRVDEETGDVYFLEINVRTILSNQIFCSAGCDFPFIVYSNFINGKEDIDCRCDDNALLMNLTLDLGVFSRLRKNRKITWREWLKSYKSKKIYHIYFAWDDLAPWLFVYRRFSLMAFKKPFLQLLG
jgi:D-aspartate ligase